MPPPHTLLEYQPLVASQRTSTLRAPVMSPPVRQPLAPPLSTRAFPSDTFAFGPCARRILRPGLYKADERFGPGVETHPDGSQDVGLWFRENLVKLCTEIPSGFSLHRYPEFKAFLTHCPARLSLTDEETMQWDLHEEQDPFFYDYKRFLLNDDLTLPPETHIYSTDHSHMPLTRSLREDLDAWIFLHDVPPLVEDGEPWFVRNETPLMVKMHKQVYKFRKL